MGLVTAKDVTGGESKVVKYVKMPLLTPETSETEVAVPACPL